MNKHIEEACKQYITQDVNPEYAIMLNGPWGCGKTYFIDELLKEPWLKNAEDKKGKNLVKISLYGVTSKEDIDTQLFYAIHEKLDNEKLRDAGTIIASFLDGTFNIDAKTAMSICFKDWSKKVRVIIVDDLERASMATHEIMGYFYNYIVGKGIRIIFIGNEDEIKGTDGKLDEHYKKTKEKVIGETYTIQPQIEDAISVFLAPERKVDIIIPKEQAIKICLKVINCLKINNLRTIWQGLVRVQRLLTAVTECETFRGVEYKSYDYGVNDNTKADYLGEILELYLVLYLQLANGEISKDDDSTLNIIKDQSIITDVIGVYKNERCSLKDLTEREAEEDKQRDNRQRHDEDFTRSMRRTPMGFVALQSSDGEGDKLWSDYLFHSKIDKTLLNSVVEEDKQWFTPKKDIKSNLYRLVSESLMMEQEEFDECYKAVIEEFLNGEYVEIGELIHGYSLCLTYKEYGVRQYKDGEIWELFDKILENTEVRVELQGDYKHVLIRGSMGYQYSTDMNEGEGKDFVDRLRKLVDEKRTATNKETFIEEFDVITNAQAFMEWVNLLHINNSGRDYNSYYEKPVLSWIGAENLFSKLAVLSFDAQFEFIDALKERFGMSYVNGVFKEIHHPDFKVLEKLEELFTEYINDIGSSHIKKYRMSIILERLKELCEYCRQFKK